jgi:hypothetical protein
MPYHQLSTCNRHDRAKQHARACNSTLDSPFKELFLIRQGAFTFAENSGESIGNELIFLVRLLYLAI